jgi:hypothetical protein
MERRLRAVESLPEAEASEVLQLSAAVELEELELMPGPLPADDGEAAF